MRSRMLWSAIAGIAVFLSTRALFPMVIDSPSVVPLWAPAGLAALGVLLAGYLALPFLFAGVFAGVIGIMGPGPAAAVAAIGILGPISFWLILRRLRPNGLKLEVLSDAAALAVAAAAGMMVSSVAGIGAGGLLGSGEAPTTFVSLAWWLSQTAAVIAIAPLGLIWRKAEGGEGQTTLDATVMAVLVLVFSWYAYSTELPVAFQRVIPFLYLPFFTWIAYRGGRRLMVVAVLAESIIATIGTLRGFGSFSTFTMDQSVMALNVVIAVFAVSSLALALLFEERARLTAAAEGVRSLLETAVSERTAALVFANESLIQQIAERRRAEEALSERELSFRLLYERAPLAYQSLDAEGRLLDVNDAWLALLGYSRDEVVGRSFSEILAPGQLDLFFERFSAFKSAGAVDGVEFTMLTKDGSRREVAVYGRVARLEDGDVKRTHCILHDVTELNKEVDALRASQQRLESIFENRHTIMVLLNPETGRFIDANAAACDFYGYTREEMVGRTLMEFNGVAPDDMLARLAGTAMGPGGIRLDRHMLKSGEVRDMEVHSGPIDVAGRRLIFATLHDVSDRVAAEKEIAEHRARLSDLVYERTSQLERAYGELEAASAAKDQFLANMSHELRTPLNSIIGFSDMLLSGLVGDLDVEHERQIGMINNSGKYLLELVNDVLDLAKIESGSVNIEPDEFELMPLLDSVMESMKPAAAEKDLGLRVECLGGFDSVSSDRRKIRQVLLNLVGNAVKFTDFGEVVLRVSCDKGDTLVFSVSDTGLGIPEEEIARVFDEFHQVAPPGEAKPSGTGLGLAISHRLARLLGGDLTATSKVGEGSEFVFTVPAVVVCKESAGR